MPQETRHRIGRERGANCGRILYAVHVTWTSRDRMGQGRKAWSYKVSRAAYVPIEKSASLAGPDPIAVSG
jgi:hypothetical protein